MSNRNRNRNERNRRDSRDSRNDRPPSAPTHIMKSGRDASETFRPPLPDFVIEVMLMGPNKYHILVGEPGQGVPLKTEGTLDECLIRVKDLLKQRELETM